MQDRTSHHFLTASMVRATAIHGKPFHVEISCNQESIVLIVSSKSTCRVVRPGSSTYTGKQGLSYFEGIAAETVGSTGICMHLLTVPPGARARRIFTPRMKRRSTRFPARRIAGSGMNWKSTSSCAKARCSIFRPASRIFQRTLATGRRQRSSPAPIRMSRKAWSCCRNWSGIPHSFGVAITARRW